MNKLSLNVEYSDYFNDSLVKHLLTLDGVNNASINRDGYEVYVEYNNNVIDLKILKLEILTYLKQLKNPSINAFNKHIDDGKDFIIHIDDICCEYCLRNMIDELLETNGVISASHNYDYRNSSVDITITYDDKIVDDNKLKEISEQFNNYK